MKPRTMSTRPSSDLLNASLVSRVMQPHSLLVLHLFSFSTFLLRGEHTRSLFHKFQILHNGNLLNCLEVQSLQWLPVVRVQSFMKLHPFCGATFLLAAQL